jgi:hypothetical protein
MYEMTKQLTLFNFKTSSENYSESLYFKIKGYILDNLNAFYTTDLTQNFFNGFDLLPEIRQPGDLFFKQLIQNEQILTSNETPEGITKGRLKALSENRDKKAVNFYLIFINNYFTFEQFEQEHKFFKFMDNGKPRIMLTNEPERESGVHDGLWFDLIDYDCRIGFCWRY